jgi:hypothetical protein
MNMTKLQVNRLGWLAAAAAFVCVPAHAADWGSLKGKFVYDGKVENSPLNITKDVEYCGQHKPVDEKIKLGEGGALQNVFVYLVVARGKTVTAHPDYKPSDEPVVLDNHGCRFEPHALVVWTAQPFEIRSTDPIGHNTNCQTLVANTRFNETITQERPIVKKFTKSEPRPQIVSCNIHPWMNALMLVRDNPYMAVSGEDGAFEIKNLPAGKLEFAFWHEAKGYVRDVKVGDEETDRKGEVELTIPTGETLDLGEIKVSPAALGQ